MIVKLQSGDKIKVESDEKREARRKYKEHSQLSIGQKLKRNLNIASNFLKAGPNITNFGNAVSALFGGFSPENPDITKGDPPAVGIKNFENLVRTARVTREFEKAIASATKNGRLEVTSNYFNSPNNWYRITETPEKFGIMEQGKNVTTTDATQTVGTINGWRSSMLKAPVTKGTGKNEGYFIKKPPKIDINIRRKNGQAHGNTSQAAKGKLWGGTTSGSNLFPEGVIEGQAPSMINYGIDRTNFVITPWEQIPNGGRVGFHTGEMPMSNLGWFQKTKNGTYTYEPIIPEKRIQVQPISKITKSKPYIRWSQKGYLNEAYNIEGGPGQKFIVVKDVDNPQPGVLNTKGNGEYSLHFHSTRDNPNKEKMFQALAESIPEGEKVSTWGTISKGGYHGINRFGEQFGWPKVGERPAVNGPVNLFQKPIESNDSKPNVYVMDNFKWKELSYPSYINHIWNKLKAKGVRTEFYDRNNVNEQTRMNFLNKGFIPVFKIYPQQNLKAHSQEILRRMKNFGLDVDNTMGELPLYGKKSIRDLVTLNSGRTSYVGYYDKPGVTGTFFHNNGTSIVDPGFPQDDVSPLQSIVTTMHHERNMHGTQKFLTPEMWKLYEDFLNKMISKISYNPHGYNVAQTPSGRKLAIGSGSHRKEELRATIGEMVKNIYDNQAHYIAATKNPNVKKYELETIRPYFEQVVDEMPDERLNHMLSTINGYGADYAEIGPKENPNFYKELRTLLKIAPASLPFLIPRKEEKK